MTTFQSLALIGISLIILSSLTAAWQVEKLRREVRQANELLKGLLTTLRDRL